jgi:hypothetical protein
VLVTDDVAYAKKFAEDTWGKSKAGAYTRPLLSST